jgi:hypothetical protein
MNLLNIIHKKIFPTDEDRNLLDYYFKSLNAKYTKNRRDNGELSQLADVTLQIDNLFEQEKTWVNAYEIEQLMVPILGLEYLDMDIGRNLVSAKTLLPKDKHDYFQDQVSQATETAQKQALLGGLIGDLHWRNQVRQLHRKYSRLTRVRTGLLFGFSIVLMFVPVFFADFGLDWISLNMALIAVASGFMGAAFSMLLSLKKRIESATLDDLKVQHRWTFMFSRAMIGLGASLILYFFLRGEILAGSFLPNFGTGEIVSPLPWKQMALLVVWSFIAGFSEKMVPNLISQAEDKLNIKTQS